MNTNFEADRQLLEQARSRGAVATLGAYVRLSGPGWLQSAITLGGGTLAGSLYLGVVSGYRLLWVQPVAMLLGIIMLAAIAYVTTSTQQPPFRDINRHVSPVLGWGWLLAALAANVFWCLPQYALATSVLQQNLLSGVATSLGDFRSKLLFAGSLLVITTIITWAYGSGGWGVRLYEFILKLMVAAIVICFFGVLFAVRNEVDWYVIASGFVPSWSSLNSPTPEFMQAISQSAHADFWTRRVVNAQQDNLVAAAATAVGINMTFLFPYSMLAKGWNKSFRGLAIFDLATGMLIPYLLATSCVVIAAAVQFHYASQRPTTAVELSGKSRVEFYQHLEAMVASSDSSSAADEPRRANEEGRASEEMTRLKNALQSDPKSAEAADRLHQFLDGMPEADRTVAAMLASRDAQDLSKALAPFAGERVANLVFGLGVLGMALSTITILMLISGFCVCEALGVEPTGWPHRLGALAAASGVLGPFIWSQASFLLAVYVSAFGLMLLPIAYWSFFFLMNRRSLMGDEMPRGTSRVVWNTLMLIAAGVTTAASIVTIYTKLGVYGIATIVAFVSLALIVNRFRK